MDPITDELFKIPGACQTVIVIIRLVTAALLGGLLGAERESVGKAAASVDFEHTCWSPLGQRCLSSRLIKPV